MRKVLLTVLLVAAFGTVFAAENPVDKGSMLLSGQVYFQTQSGDLYENMDGDAITTMAFQPEVGYFVAPNIMVGASLEYFDQSQGDAGVTRFGIGPMVGYFFDMTKDEVQGSIYPYIIGFFRYSSVDVEGLDDSQTWTMFGGKGGIHWMLSDAVSLNAGVQVSTDSYDSGAEGAESISGITMWVGAGISAFVY